MENQKTKCNFGIKTDLQKLNNAFLRNFTSATTGATKRCICIPIDDNPSIYLGEKGCYLGMTAVEVTNPQYGDTHILKPDMPKDIYQAMTQEQRDALPILGNMRPIPNGQAITQTVNSDAPEGEPADDLPW